MAVDINMYGLKYEFSRTSTNGADILITIHKKWYEGEVIKRALGRAPIIKRENKDHIYGTSCELYLECKVDGEFAEMYTSDPYEYRVSVYKNDTLLWIGYVSPELYSEPDIAPPYDVQVIATDGLGGLKNKDFEKRGVASLLSHFNYLIGAAMPFSIVSDLRYENENGVEVAAKEILNIKVNLDHESGENCYDVLQHLLKSLNANITQLNGRYLIFRETDFITKASDAGVEAFDVNGDKMVLPIAMFGSMRSHQWWPVGQLSTVVEPAKNKVTLTAPDNYKNNVLDFASWSLINASYLEKEGAYSLPNKNSAITQSLDFGGQEVGYRLGLRVRARNVGVGQYGGTSDKAQNLGLKVEMEGRAFADYLGPNFWLIKSEGISSGSPLADYMWKSNEERAVEEELRNPSSADSAADAQNIDIVLPLFDDGTNTYGSYAYAKKIKVTIFNPAGEHGIYVYDVSLVKYEQIKGYQADVVIDNAAREVGSDVELTLSSGIYAPAAAEVFMTGLPLQQSGHDIITQWKVGDGQMREYLTAMSYDYSRAVALPKMKYAGILNVPGSEALLPILFLRDGTYYFPKTYSYDLYADEITVELLSISAADVSLGSVVISQTSEAAGTMGGVTTGGTSGGGGAVSVPRDKEMSDTSDNAVENRVIKAYVDDLRDQLLDLWHIDENGNLVTDKQVLIKNNLIVENDTSSGGDGQDTPSAGLDEEQLQDYLDLHKYVTESRVQEMIDEVAAGDVDLTNYYTKQEVDAKIPSLDGYAKEGYVDDAITALNVGQYAKASDLENLQAEVDNIDAVLGLSETAEGYINTWAEVKAFLDGYKNADDLATILSGINADIAKNAENIATLDNDKADKATTLAGYGITDAYTKSDLESYKTWWDAVMGLVVKDGNNIRIKTNLIVEGDTSSGGSGQDTPASGTVTGIKVSASETLTPNNAGIIDMVSVLSSIDVSDQLKEYAKLTDITKSMVDSVLGSTTAGNANRFLMSTGSTSVWSAVTKSMVASALGASTGGRYLIDTGGDVSWVNAPTSLPASDVYAWAKKPSLALADVPDLSSKYLPLAGGTIDGNITIRAVSSSKDSWLYFTDKGTSEEYAIGIRRPTSSYGLQFKSKGSYYTIYHSGNFNPADYLPLSGGKMTGTITVGDYTAFGQTGGNFYLGTPAYPLLLRSNGTTTINGNTLIHSGNIGRQNAGSATKLETARTIWGQSFDGTGKVSGNITLGAASIRGYDNRNILESTANDLMVGYGYATSSLKTTIFGNTIKLNDAVLINSSGNVTIGGSDLAGTNWKAYINGSTRIANITITSGVLNTNRNVNTGALLDSSKMGFEIEPFASYVALKGYNTSGTGVGGINIASSGNVLIGTTTDKGAKLQIYSSSSTTTPLFTIEKGGAYDAKLELNNTVDKFRFIQQSTGNAFISLNGNHSLVFETSDTTRMIITGGGNVGIGISNPQYKLDVSGDIATNQYLRVKARTGYGSGSCDMWYNGNTTSLNMGSRLRMAYGLTIDSEGASITGVVTMSSTLSVSGNITCSSNLIVSGDTSSGSDIRFKDIIKNKTIKIEHIAKAPLFTFKWNDREDDSIHLGSSAQYWEKVCPWLVKGENFKTLDYSTLGVAIGISLAKKAVNHEERIKVLERKVKSLEEENRRLRYGS